MEGPDYKIIKLTSPSNDAWANVINLETKDGWRLLQIHAEILGETVNRYATFEKI